MNRWKLAVSVIACMAVASMGCAATVQPAPPQGPAPQPQGEAEAAPAEVVVNLAPPAEQIESVPVAPSAEMVWIKGHWHWNGATWNWIRGHYSARRVGWRWVPAHYVQRGPNWVYVGPHWAR